MSLQCLCSNLLEKKYCTTGYYDDLCNQTFASRKGSTCLDKEANLKRINQTVQQAASLYTMKTSASCSIQKNKKNGSYQRVLMRRKQCLVSNE